jgi:hypothetical protein
MIIGLTIFCDAKTNTSRKSETPKSQRTKHEIQSERTREVEMSLRERPAATPRISRTSTPVFSSPSDSSKKEEKKNQKRERAKPGENISRSPSMEEQRKLELASRIMEAGGLHYSFAGCAASWRA